MNEISNDSVRIVLADDHPPTLAGLRSMIQEFKSYEIVGEADNGRDALELVLSMNPDLLLIDIEMPEMTGIEVTKSLKSSGNEVRIIALSAFDYREYVYGILDGGASGYLKKEEASSDTLRAAIETVLEDEGMWISPALASQLVRAQIRERDTQDILQALSVREKDVLDYVGHGRTNKEIAEILFISSNTVKNHVDHIRQKLGMKTRNELIAWAWERKVVSAE